MTCPIKHALDQCQLALGRVQQRQPQAGYTFTATYEAISAARAELARRTPPAEVVAPDWVEALAESWDGCMYDAPGETIDIGESIRRAALTAPQAQDVQR